MDLSKRFCRKCNHRCHATVECGRCKTEAANGFGKGCGACECPDCISIVEDAFLDHISVKKGGMTLSSVEDQNKILDSCFSTDLSCLSFNVTVFTHIFHLRVKNIFNW